MMKRSPLTSIQRQIAPSRMAYTNVPNHATNRTWTTTTKSKAPYTKSQLTIVTWVSFSLVNFLCVLCSRFLFLESWRAALRWIGTTVYTAFCSTETPKGGKFIYNHLNILFRIVLSHELHLTILVVSCHLISRLKAVLEVYEYIGKMYRYADVTRKETNVDGKPSLHCAFIWKTD
jgi:hypothetical protein